MKTLLLNLPENINEVSDYTSLINPIGLASISGFLKSRGKDVVLLDAFGLQLSRENIIKAILRISPDLLGVTIMTNNVIQIVDFCECIKELLPNIKIVAGGPHPTIEFHSLLSSCSVIDIVAIGEGEVTLLELIESLCSGKELNNVNGIAYRSGKEIKVNNAREYIENLDELPFSDWDSLPLDKYYDRWTIKKNNVGMSFSRGCPFNCSFCMHNFIGKKIRRYSPERIIEEIKFLYDNHHVRNISVMDSTLNVDNDWLQKICEGIIGLNRPIFWGCEYRADFADEKILKLMKRSGCRHLFMGLESADNNILKRIRKGETIEQIKLGIEIANRIGIYPDLGCIVGLPGETKETIRKTVDFALQYPRNSWTITFATPYPGTELYEIAKGEGWIGIEFAKYSMHKIAYVPKGMTKDELGQYYRYAVRKIFLRWKYIFYQILRVRSWLFLKIALRYTYRLFLKRVKQSNK